MMVMRGDTHHCITSFFHSSSHQQLLPADRHGKIEVRLFILHNLQLEIINFLYKNLRKAEY
jgi:hypothetical protein